MDLSAGKVVDVFSYLGDASAAGAEEIGTAMQKASASAQEAGISFEWLGAYIATVSEKTRQSADVIGTSFNSIMSRLQNIKMKGFNEEDATKINDVAKALDEVGVALMDQNGNWRDMSTIFLEVSEQWGSLDDKTRSYLATTLAGTRQKNIFLTLMEDMSKMGSETEKTSRALELYYGALSSAGSASEKYAIRQESVASAQARLNAEIEEFKSKIANSGLIKGFYNVTAGLMDLINKGLNIVTAITGAFAGLFAVLKGAQKATGAATLFSALAKLPKGKITIVLAGIAAGITAITSAFGALKKVTGGTENADKGWLMEEYQGDLDTIFAMRKEYEELFNSQNKTASQQARMISIVETLAERNLDLKEALSDSEGGFKTGTEAIEAMNGEYDKLLARMRAVAQEEKNKLWESTAFTDAQNDYSNKKAYESVYKRLLESVPDADAFNSEETLTEIWNQLYSEVFDEAFAEKPGSEAM